MTGEISTDGLKSYEPDRYFAALLAPKTRRDDALAVVGLAAELRRISWDVSEPMLGEIRLQWWQDSLRAWQPDRLSGSPVADAVARVAAAHGLPQDVVESIIDGAMALQTAMPSSNLAGRAAEYAKFEGGLFTLVAIVLGDGDGEREAIARAAAPAGVAYGLARCRFDRMHRPDKIEADGEVTEAALPVWRDEALAQLKVARSAIADIHGAARPAYLPLALVEPYLRLVAPEAIRRDRKGNRPQLSQLRRMWLIWRWHLTV